MIFCSGLGYVFFELPPFFSFVFVRTDSIFSFLVDVGLIRMDATLISLSGSCFGFFFNIEQILLFWFW